MSNTELRTGHRPSIKVINGGKPYLVLHTRRGPRTRQINRDGLAWLRERYPAEDYPMVEDIPLTFDDYRMLVEQDCIGLRKRASRWATHVPSTISTNCSAVSIESKASLQVGNEFARSSGQCLWRTDPLREARRRQSNVGNFAVDSPQIRSIARDTGG